MSESPTVVTAGRRVFPAAAGARVARLYEEHARALFGLCRMLLRDPDEAEDAAQSAFLAAHGALIRGTTPRDEAAWLFAIARNECRGRIRQRMAAPLTSGDDELADVPAPDSDPAQQTVDPVVRNALAALPDRQREAVVLHDVLGLRAREVGGVLGLSLPAVEALLFRARRQLRVRLEPIAGALTVPLGLRDALVQAIPGFADGSGGAGAAATGAAGLGLLAKLASAPAVAKVAAAGVAVTAAGTVAVARERPPTAPATVVSARSAPAAPASSAMSSDNRSGSAASHVERSGRPETGGGGSARDDDGRPGSGNEVVSVRSEEGDASTTRAAETERSGPSTRDAAADDDGASAGSDGAASPAAAGGGGPGDAATSEPTEPEDVSGSPGSGSDLEASGDGNSGPGSGDERRDDDEQSGKSSDSSGGGGDKPEDASDGG